MTRRPFETVGLTVVVILLGGLVVLGFDPLGGREDDGSARPPASREAPLATTPPRLRLPFHMHRPAHVSAASPAPADLLVAYDEWIYVDVNGDERRQEEEPQVRSQARWPDGRAAFEPEEAQTLFTPNTPTRLRYELRVGTKGGDTRRAAGVVETVVSEDIHQWGGERASKRVDYARDVVVVVGWTGVAAIQFAEPVFAGRAYRYRYRPYGGTETTGEGSVFAAYRRRVHPEDPDDPRVEASEGRTILRAGAIAVDWSGGNDEAGRIHAARKWHHVEVVRARHLDDVDLEAFVRQAEQRAATLSASDR